MEFYRFLAMLCVAVFFAGNASAARISDVSNTVHNLSMSWGGEGADPREITAVSEQRICVFCHTPHHSNNVPQAPLWNRKLAGDPGYDVAYTMYDTASMDSNRIAGVPSAPSNSSKLCLSCHDGTIAVGSVNVLNARTNQTIAMNSSVTTMPFGTLPEGGSARNTGLTRNLGIDLSNDHPISITYDSALVSADGELTDPMASPHVGVRGPGVRPLIPLIPDPLDGNKPKLECVSCHDPHVRDDSGADIKFLRLNRFQTDISTLQDSSGLRVDFDPNADIICLACHNKDGWVNSAHANPAVANEIYDDEAATARDFPLNIQVWEAACLNCHDTHTVAGSRRLLREGTDAMRVGGEKLKRGGGYPAIEETCYQCHSNDGATLRTQGFNTEVPDIKSDFQLERRMPITTQDQPGAFEMHNIGSTGGDGDGKDFIESQAMLGKGAGNLNNRHVECTDCHNPHRVIKNNLASDNPYYAEAAGTHQHTGTIHNNLISGVLRGSWGVEPVYSSNSFHDSPTSFNVKRGVPEMGRSMSGPADSYSYVTREYQVCLKCHSNYGFDDNNPPLLGSFTGGTPIGTNGMTRYTNQAKEFYAPESHKGEPKSVGWDGGACNLQTTMNTNNHRSWHPVMDNTGRNAYSRGNMSANAFLPPWDVGIGSQTMYCSDCHGSNTGLETVEPNDGVNGRPWGPHGSENNFLLKGSWIQNEVGSVDPNRICFKCHDIDAYANAGAAAALNGGSYAKASGFQMALGPGYDAKMGGEIDNNLHIGHAYVMKTKYGTDTFKCNWCHVAVPHGWKNKALLASSTDLGREAGLADCTNTWERGPDPPTTRPPYYYNFVPLLTSFAPSGKWTVGNCQGLVNMQNLCTSPP